MHLAFSDWLIILLYFVASAAIGLPAGYPRGWGLQRRVP